MKRILIGLAVVIIAAGVVISGLAAFSPDLFRVERQVTIRTPPQNAYVLISDFRAWTRWSPWEGRDPAMKREYGGALAGVGATYEWDGNAEVGAGRMEILEAAAPSRVRLQITFTRPFEASNTVEFTLVPDAEGTRVGWAMSGRSPFVARVMRLFMDMDGMIGRDFELGLANLKREAER